MLTIAYLGNGKCTNRYHLPFSSKLTNKINIKKIFSPSEPVWKTFEVIEYTEQLSVLWDDPEFQLVV
ncbi:NAD(P)-dependent oxidoreductase, partial [Enterococcus faecium]